MKTEKEFKRVLYGALSIIIGGGVISGVIFLNTLIPSSPPQKYTQGKYPILSPQFMRFLFPEARAQGGVPNSIFLPEIPFGGPASACICDCNYPIARVEIGAPSKYRWPGKSTEFMFMPFTYKHIKNRPFPPSGGSQTVGKAFDVGREPVCITRTANGCVFCGEGDPILYVGEAGGSVQPTGSTEANPWVPPF